MLNLTLNDGLEGTKRLVNLSFELLRKAEFGDSLSSVIFLGKEFDCRKGFNLSLGRNWVSDMQASPRISYSSVHL